MKILFLSHKFNPEFGGIEVNSEMLANAFHEAGHEVRLMTWTGETGNTQFPYPVLRNPNAWTLIRENKWADVVFENNPCLRLGWPAFLFRKPTVIALCTWINVGETAMSMQDKLKLYWLKRAAAVIAVSEAVKHKCWPGAVVISNPYRHELFRKMPGVKKDADFVFLGRLVSDKGADMAIAALHELSKEPSNENKPQLTIIGDGDEMDSLKKMAVSLEVANQVTFTGSLKGQALVNCLNKHRILLVPSTWEEPFGNVALEGMACDCIPVVSDGGGLPEAVGKAGISFARGNVAALVNSIKMVQQNGDLRQKLQAEATAHLEAHQLEEISRKYLEVLQKAANS